MIQRHRRKLATMAVKDSRELAAVMELKRVSHRDLAEAAGYGAHSYISRLVRGEAKTLNELAALRIARHLGMQVEDLFVHQTSTNSGQTGQKKGAA